jgi:class 3 adenylate cyclase
MSGGSHVVNRTFGVVDVDTGRDRLFVATHVVAERLCRSHCGPFLADWQVTLLLADVEGSTRMWENQPDAMAAALATSDLVLAELVHANHVVPA